MLVILIDDDPAVLAPYAAGLRRAGCDVEARRDAKDVVALARRLGPAAIVLDVSLPGTSGLDACAQLKGQADLARIPVLILSGHSSFEACRRATEAGADRYLLKPQPIADLRRAIDREVARMTTPASSRRSSAAGNRR